LFLGSGLGADPAATDSWAAAAPSGLGARPQHQISDGSRTRLATVEVIRPPRMTMAIGPWISRPV